MVFVVQKKKHVVFFSGSFADRLVWICSTGCFMATDEELRALRLQDLSDPLAALLGDGDATTKATEESSGLNFSRIWRSIMGNISLPKSHYVTLPRRFQ